MNCSLGRVPPALLGCLVGLSACTGPVETDQRMVAALAPPVAIERVTVVKSPHGERRDEYYWLRDDHPERKSDEVMSYLRAEQAFTSAMLARLAPLQARLASESRARIAEDDSTPRQFDHGWWTWTAFSPGDEQQRWMRSRDDGAGQVMLDGNELAKGHAYFRVGDVEVSHDGSLVAWTEDTVGRRGHELRMRDLSTGKDLPDRIRGTLESVVWAADGRSIFYMRQDPVLLQSGPVCRHVLGTDPASDTIVYQEPDQTLFTSIDASRCRTLLRIQMEGYDTNELRTVPLANPADAPRVALPRTAGVRHYADRLNGTWLIRTNLNARNFRIAVASDAELAEPGRWRELVPHRTDAAIDDASLLEQGVAVAERVDANARVRIVPWSGGEGRLIATDEAACTMTLGDNPDPANRWVRVEYGSMITPQRTIDVDLATGAQQVRKERTVRGYDRSRYASARLWAPSRDGKRIPISIAWRNDAWAHDGAHPALLEAYGAYGYASDARFDLPGVSLMDRGVALVTVHVRGGADLGQDWYEDGRLLRKRNTFNDFIDATDWLVRERWVDAKRVFASGGSAGGLLMGAVANMAGDRYRGIILGVPFVDALTTMLDPSIPLTTNEWSQWGNPIESREAYEYILSYSPYDNIQAKDYPAMLVTTGLWDSQVGYFEPAKFVARLRRLKTDREPLLFDIEMAAGHGGRTGRFDRLARVAREQAFVLDLAGVRD
ncbi:MAG: S9 family peptidase [Phycisphaerae bacterium]|nr:S9 family peptidase [Phycisphaerae bacterium]